MVAAAAVLFLLIGPLCFATLGLRRAERAALAPAGRWNPHQTLSSALLCALAFNLTFLIQELFLVLPKALTPGVRVTLFHNNHAWTGDNPLVSLFQGTGALAILLSSLFCAWLLERRSERSATATLFLIWMVYDGVFQSLPQVVLGAVSPQNDVGMAMDYLRLSAGAKTVAALLALACMPLCAWWLTRHFLAMAPQSDRLSGVRARNRFVFQLVTLPALIAIPLIIPFRVPRELIEVVAPPLVVNLVGALWIQALAWGGRAARAPDPVELSIAYPLAALTALLLLCQLFLRRGIAFY
jgi:hypothetical protein